MRRRNPGVATALSDVPEGPREKLLVATIQEIERVGLDELTVRGIVNASGMNIASVNYHFESKARLVTEAMHRAADHLLHDALALLEGAATPADGVAALFEYLHEGARRYPRVTRAHLSDPLFVGQLAALVESLSTVVRRIGSGLDAAQSRRRAMALVSEALFPAAFSALFPGILSTATQRRAYVAEMTARLGDTRST